MQKGRFTIALAALAALSACEANTQESENEQATEPSDPAAFEAETDEAVSILRPEIEQPEAEEPPLQSLNATVGFPQGGTQLETEAVATLRSVVDSEQIALGGPIVLRGHSDAAGSDEVNERVSRNRAEAVKSWLTDNGIDSERIEIIAFGEQNPVEPNALPDGTPNEAGRELNRRVEIEIVPPAQPSESGDAAASE